MGKTKIEWTDFSWNPVTGCDNQLPCRKNCYARRMAKRLAGRYGYPEAPNEFKPTFHADKLDEPKKIKKPSRIFVCSMGDMFCDGVSKEWRSAVTDKIRVCPQHTFIILTKKPYNAVIHQQAIHGRLYPENLIIGTSASTQEELNLRIRSLVQISATRRIISLEPLLEGISIIEALDVLVKINGEYEVPAVNAASWLHGVIVGGETGTGARPMHPDWVRKIRDDCKELGIKFFFKGFGEWGLNPVDDWKSKNQIFIPDNNHYAGGFSMFRVGKKHSGRLLDGGEHNDLPAIAEKEA